MTSERWQRISAIFHAALTHAPGERESYLVGACRDDRTLRGEVEAMLAGHDDARKFGEIQLFTSASRIEPDSAGGPLLVPGSHLGPYRDSRPARRRRHGSGLQGL